MKVLTAAARRIYGNVPVTTISMKISGDMARVTYGFAVPALRQTDEPWILQSGQWREDDC